MSVSTAVRLPEVLAARYDELARSTGRSRTYYLVEALSNSIEQLEYEYGLLDRAEKYRKGLLETVSLDEVERRLGLAD